MFRLALATVLGLSVAACGGGSKNTKGAKSGGTVSYEDQPTDMGNGTPPATDDQQVADNTPPPADEPPPADTPPPKEPEPPPKPKAQPKPPGEDLSEAEKTKRIETFLKEGNEATKREEADTMIRDALSILDIDQANVNAMVMLAHGYFLKNLDDKAEGVLEEARKRNPAEAPKNAKLWMILGLIYDRSTRANHDDLALMAYSSAINNNSRYTKAYTNRGVIYLQRKAFRLDDGGGAVADFEAADGLELGAAIGDDERASCKCRSAGTCTHLGAAYRGLSAQEGQSRDALLQRAERCFKNAMSVNASYAPAYFDMGLLYLDADPFPGLDKLKRLNQAKTYLTTYKAKAGASIKPKDQQAVDSYIDAAQKAYDTEVKTQELKAKAAAAKKKRDEEKAKKDADKKPDEGGDKKPDEGGGDQ